MNNKPVDLSQALPERPQPQETPMNEIPRRAQWERLTLAERAIYDAVQAVENMPADVRLTDAVVLLQAARHSVADFVDGIERRRSVSEGSALTGPLPQEETP